MNPSFARRFLPLMATGLFFLFSSCDQALQKTLDCDLSGHDFLDGPRTVEARISWIWQASVPASMNCRSVFLVGVDYWPEGKPAGFGSPGWRPNENEERQIDAMNSSAPPVKVYITTTTRSEPFAFPHFGSKPLKTRIL